MNQDSIFFFLTENVIMLIVMLALFSSCNDLNP